MVSALTSLPPATGRGGPGGMVKERLPIADKFSHRPVKFANSGSRFKFAGLALSGRSQPLQHLNRCTLAARFFSFVGRQILFGNPFTWNASDSETATKP